MNDSFSHTQVKQLKQVVEEVLDEKLEERLQPLKINIDAILKIAMDDRDELEITKAKVETIARHLNLSV
jgi:hypothetical protein